MLNFADFLAEAAGDALKANTNDAKTKGHIKRYIFKMLSSEQKKQSLNDLGDYFNDKDVKDSDHHNHGETHDPNAEFTHTMSSSHGGHAKGTPIKVTGVYRDGNTIMARTSGHGTMPISKLAKPGKLAASSITKMGTDVENELQSNLDPTVKPAGNSKTAFDFTAGDISNKERSVRGKVVKNLEGETAPIIRGEAKASKTGSVAMGSSELRYTPEKKWHFTNKDLADKFGESTVSASGLKLIDHLNTHHSDGIISKGFSVGAAPGTASEYLRRANNNMLHLHRYGTDKNGNVTTNHGTTYTIGDDNSLKGQLGVGHLSEDDLLNLDGRLQIEATRSSSGGSTSTVKHKPPVKIVKQLANNSITNPESHGSLHNKDHAEKIRGRFEDFLKSQTPEQKSNLARPSFKPRSLSVNTTNLETAAEPVSAPTKPLPKPIQTNTVGGLPWKK